MLYPFYDKKQPEQAAEKLITEAVNTWRKVRRLRPALAVVALRSNLGVGSPARSQSLNSTLIC